MKQTYICKFFISFFYYKYYKNWTDKIYENGSYLQKTKLLKVGGGRARTGMPAAGSQDQDRDSGPSHAERQLGQRPTLLGQAAGREKGHLIQQQEAKHYPV